MAEFLEVMKQRKRMHNFYNKSNSCSKCPLHSENNGTGKVCINYINEHYEEAGSIIMKWAEENPIKTNADKLKEVFGIEFCEGTQGCNFIVCPHYPHYRSCSNCEYKGFWEQEYKEPTNED